MKSSFCRGNWRCCTDGGKGQDLKPFGQNKCLPHCKIVIWSMTFCSSDSSNYPLKILLVVANVSKRFLANCNTDINYLWNILWTNFNSPIFVSMAWWMGTTIAFEVKNFLREVCKPKGGNAHHGSLSKETLTSINASKAKLVEYAFVILTTFYFHFLLY